VLQAIVAWGDAVSAEANALASYNTELANLERQTGTILETHGVRFQEEQWQFAGPLLKHEVCYPADVRPVAGDELRYLDSDEPAENFFDLSNPIPTRTGSGDADVPPLRPHVPPLPMPAVDVDATVPEFLPELPRPEPVPAPAGDAEPRPIPPQPAKPVEPPPAAIPPDISLRPADEPGEDRASRRQRRRARKTAQQQEPVVR